MEERNCTNVFKKIFVSCLPLYKCSHTMGPPSCAKALNQTGPLRKRAALLAVIPFELLIIFIFQTQHIHWLITILLVTIYVFAHPCCSQSRSSPGSGCTKLTVGYVKGRLSFLPKISSSYKFAERSHVTFILILEGYPELLVSVNTGWF